MKPNPPAAPSAAIKPSSTHSRRRTFGVVALAACSLLLAAWGDSEADKFVGQWRRAKYPKETLTVTKDGRRLVFVAHDYTSKEPRIGELKSGVVTFGALSSASLRENGNLIVDGREYTK